MRKSLRVGVPALQVLAFVGLVILKSVSITNYKINFNVYLPIHDLLMRVNYPLAVVWFGIDYATRRIGLSQSSAGLVVTMLTVSVGAILLASVALFWYLVVREFEMRRSGTSLFRFRGRIWPLLAISILFLLGGSAFTSACLDVGKRIPFMLRNGSGIGLVLTLAPEIALFVWATVLIRMSVADFQSFLRTPRLE